MLGFKRRRRAHLRQRPLSPEWLAIVERNVPYYRLLAPEEQRELQGHIQVLLAEKRFEGLGGLTITDEIRLTIAAQAAVLLLHRDTDYFPELRSILVYPSAYVAHAPRRQPDGTIIEGPEVRSGESWHRGPVVLSWDDVLRGASDAGDGRNVVFHEFAHALDSESGAVDGAPDLGLRSRYIAWARVLGREFARLREDIAWGRDALIDAYGAVNPPEFFAVVTESFFERPLALRARHPELYEQMVAFYRQDPAARLQPGGGSAPRVR